MVNGRDLAKYILYVLLVLLLAFGTTAIVFGILMLTGNTSYQKNLSLVVACGSLLIIGGAFLFPAIVLGTLGALKDSVMFLRIFATLTIISFLAAIASVTTLRFAKDPKYVKQRLETTLDDYIGSKENRGFWKRLQRDYKCCGIDGYGDWESKVIALPPSCCKESPSAEAPDENDSCKSLGKSLSYIYKNGCRQELVDAQNLFCLTATCVKAAFFVCCLVAAGAAWWIASDISQRFLWF